MTVLALMGSGEFLPQARAVDLWCAERSTAGSERALVVPTASAPEGPEVFERWATMGIEHYRALGLDPHVVPLRTRADAERAEVVDAVADARIIFFSGGNPGYLVETLRATPFWDAVLDAVTHGSALGGCSAGAVAAGVLAPFVSGERIERWTEGLRLLARAFVVPHFDALESYEPGLRSTVLRARPEGSITVAIDEDTSLCGDGSSWSVLGAGRVWTGTTEEELAAAEPGTTLSLPLEPAI